jgi:hypothetical protein
MGKIPDAQPERRLILGPTASIPRGSIELRQPTGPQATDLNRLVKPGGQFSTACGPYTVFRKASERLCLSNERSATSRFNRLFASSTCRRRRSSLTPRCAYCFFQE